MRSIRTLSFGLLCCLTALSACNKKSEDKTAPAEAAAVKAMAAPAAVQVPDDVIAYGVAGNLQALIKELELLASQAGPVPPGAISGMITGQLAQIGLKDPSVILLDKPAGLLILNPKLHPQPLIVAVTTKGEDALLKTMQPTWKSKGAKEGIHELSREALDTYGVFKGGDQAAAKKTESAFLKFSNNVVLLAQDSKALAANGDLLVNLLKSAGGSSSASLVLKNGNLRKAFQAEMAMFPQMLKQQATAALQAQPGAISSPAAMQWLAGWLVDKALAFVQQTAEIDVGVATTKDGAVLSLGFKPEANSFFAQFLASQKPGSLGLADALPAQGFMAMAVNLQWDAFKKDMKGFVAELIEKFGGSKASPEFLAAMDESLALMGDEIAIIEDFGADGAMGMVEIFQVKDEAKFISLMARFAKLFSEFAGAGQGFAGFKFSIAEPKKIGQHAGVDLYAMDMSMDLSALPQMQAEMIRKMYGGDKLQVLVAAFDKKAAVAFGKTADADLKAVIDRLKNKQAALTASPMFKNAAGGLEKDAGGYLFMSLSNVIASSIQSTFAMMGNKAPEMKLPEPRSGLFFRAKSADGRLNFTIRVPSEHLKELSEVFKAISQGTAG